MAEPTFLSSSVAVEGDNTCCGTLSPLPLEVIDGIAAFLPPRDALRAALANKRLGAVVRRCEALWMPLLQAWFPWGMAEVAAAVAAERAARGGFTPFGEGVDLASIMCQHLRDRFGAFYALGCEPIAAMAKRVEDARKAREEPPMSSPPPIGMFAALKVKLSRIFSSRWRGDDRGAAITPPTPSLPPKVLSWGSASSPLPHHDSPPPLLKVPVLSFMSGGCALVERLVTDRFLDSVPPSHGLSFRTVECGEGGGGEGVRRRIALWEAAGSKRFHATVLHTLLSRARCVVFCIDGSSSNAECLEERFASLAAALGQAPRGCPFMIVVTKTDRHPSLVSVPDVYRRVAELMAQDQQENAKEAAKAKEGSGGDERLDGELDGGGSVGVRRWAVRGTSAKLGKGFNGMLEWIAFAALENEIISP